jgi:DNA ligase-1
VAAWQRLDRDERFVFGKLITGAFRVGTARQLVYRALAEATAIPVADITHRLIGEWTPSPEFFERLRVAVARAAAHHPYPFFLAYPLEDDPATLGELRDWQAEWKWDGIRAQILRRDDGASVWSRGEDLVNDAFPELVAASQALPSGTVLDGEILAWAEMPTRRCRSRGCSNASIARRRVPSCCAIRRWCSSPTICSSTRASTRASGRLVARRSALETLLPVPPSLRLSPPLLAADWPGLAALRAASREHRAEGLMLKRLDSSYGVGRVRGPWWKWKIEPYTIDAVLCTRRRPRQARVALHRLHVRRLARRRARAVREGISRASPTRRSAKWTRGCARTRWSASGRCAVLHPNSSSSWRSRRSRRRADTRAASPCAFRESCAGAPTSAPRRPIRSRLL